VPRGGPRPGAGRPRKATLYQSAIREAEQKVADRLPHIVDKLLELVDGVYVVQHTKDGEERIYVQPPDRQAAIHLLDRIMGRPTEHVELDADIDVGGDATEQLTPEQRAAVRAALLGNRAGAPGRDQRAGGDQ